jgi:peptide/nickel transport system substrate-binding protein
MSYRTVITAASIAAAVCVGPMASAEELADNQVLRLGVGVDDIRTIDPHFSVGVGEWPIFGAVYESLVRFPRGTMDAADLQPALATEWSADDSGLVWTFTLREGVEWHHGYGAFTADDVVFSLERLRDENNPSPHAGLLSAVTDVEAVDDLTVRITTDAVVPNMPALLVNNNIGYILSRAALDDGIDPTTHPIGTGPFQFDEYRPRESFNLAANPDYWGGEPRLERFVVQFMPDASTRELALMAGEIHGIDIPARQDALDRMRGAGMEVDLTSPANMFALYLNMSLEPINDIRVREALYAGIDREALAAYFGEDVAYVENSALPQGYIGQTDDVRVVDHDPERARELLAEAGFEDGLTMSIAISNNNIYLPPMQVIQEMWRGIGVDLQMNVVDHPTFHRIIRENANPVVIYGAFRYPLDGSVYLTQFYHSASAIGQPGQVINFSHFGHHGASVDNLIEEAQFEMDQARQIELWEEAQRIIADEIAVVPLYTRSYALARSPKMVLGFETRSRSNYEVTEKARILR